MIIVNVRYLLIRSRCRSSGTKYINRECEPTTISTSNPAYPKEIILENISSRELNRLRMQIVPYNGPTIPSHKVAAFSLPRIHTHGEHLPNRYPLYENVKIKILCKTPQSGAFFFRAIENAGRNGDLGMVRRRKKCTMSDSNYTDYLPKQLIENFTARGMAKNRGKSGKKKLLRIIFDRQISRNLPITV